MADLLTLAAVLTVSVADQAWIGVQGDAPAIYQPSTIQLCPSGYLVEIRLDIWNTLVMGKCLDGTMLFQEFANQKRWDDTAYYAPFYGFKDDELIKLNPTGRWIQTTYVDIPSAPAVPDRFLDAKILGFAGFTRLGSAYLVDDTIGQTLRCCSKDGMKVQPTISNEECYSSGNQLITDCEVCTTNHWCPLDQCCKNGECSSSVLACRPDESSYKPSYVANIYIDSAYGCKVPLATTTTIELNEGAGGKDIHLCYQTILPGSDHYDDPDWAIYDVLLTTSYTCPASFQRISQYGGLNGDLNQGSGGADLYLCYTTSPRAAMTPLASIDTVYKGSQPPAVNWQPLKVGHYRAKANLHDWFSGFVGGGKIIAGTVGMVTSLLSLIVVPFAPPAAAGSAAGFASSVAGLVNGIQEVRAVASANNVDSDLGDLNQGAGGSDIYLYLKWTDQDPSWAGRQVPCYCMNTSTYSCGLPSAPNYREVFCPSYKVCLGQRVLENFICVYPADL